jgi:hypothetical protein
VAEINYANAKPTKDAECGTPVGSTAALRIAFNRNPLNTTTNKKMQLADRYILHGFTMNHYPPDQRQDATD